MNQQDKKIDRAEEKIQEIEKTIPEARTPISFRELEERINKWLLLGDKWLIKVVAASVIANKLNADPVWLFIVAPPGGTKTELIRGLNKIEGVYPISDLTTQTFLSGDKGNKNASLLLRLPAEGTILTFKDFTSVLTMHRDKRQTILSQLREIYDGSYVKPFGTGETKSWEGKMGFISGVTSVIDNHQSVFAVLGERFIQYRPEQPDTIALAKRAMANSGGEKKMRDDIQNAFADFVAGITIPNETALVSDDIKNRIAHLATFCVKARSGVIRDGYSSREIELIPDTELPTRLAKQFITLASAFALIGNTTPEEDYGLVFKIGMDTLPKKRKKVFEILMSATERLETSEVAMEIGYPTNTTRRILEDLHGLSLVDREKDGLGKGYADKWRISDYAKNVLEIAKPTYAAVENPIDSDNQSSVPETSDGLREEINKVFSEDTQTTLPEMSNQSLL